MRRRLRRAVAMLLLAQGCLGLLATGGGVSPTPSWTWLVVLLLAVVVQVAGDHFDQRLRLARRTERRLEELEEHLEDALELVETYEKSLRERIDSVGTPEGMKALVENVNRIALDLKPLREEWETVRSTGGLRALVNRR